VPVSATWVRRLAFASLLGNLAIVLTGGAVRLTDSGLGCPTWPRCSDASWTATAEMGLHGVIENTNRGLGVLLGAVALAGFLATLRLRPRRASLVRLSGAVLAGVAAQGAIGGITVWTDLNPWIVGAHFLISMALVAIAYAFWRRVDEPDGPVRPTVPTPLRTLTWLLAVVSTALVAVGTVVTGSGPHAGDADVPRNGLDPQALAQVHADLAFLLLGLAVASWFALRATAAHPAARRAAAALVTVILGQGAIGLIQYATGLPELAVWLHLVGASLVWLATLHLLHTTRTRVPVAAGAGQPRERLLAAG
jgi:cytochrome c oxidase assembly protein subunit 15